VNGDVQRGKSLCEAFMVLIVKRINDSTACADKCCSVLGTVLMPWAADVTNKMTRVGAAPALGPAPAPAGAQDAPAGAQEAGEEEAAEEQTAVTELQADCGALFDVAPICGTGVSRDQLNKRLRDVVSAGGCIVFSRTAGRIDKLTKLLFDITTLQSEKQEVVTAHFVILDEARHYCALRQARRRGRGWRQVCLREGNVRAVRHRAREQKQPRMAF
jgi:hypothetical protein